MEVVLQAYSLQFWGYAFQMSVFVKVFSIVRRGINS